MALTTAELSEVTSLSLAPAHTVDSHRRLSFDAKSHRDFENAFGSESQYSYQESGPQEAKYSLEATKPDLATELKRSEASTKLVLERFEGGGAGGGSLVGVGAAAATLTVTPTCASHTIDAILGLRSNLKGAPSPPHLHGLNNNTSTNNMNVASPSPTNSSGSGGGGSGGGGRGGSGGGGCREDGADTDDSTSATPTGPSNACL
ncbi:uncharacterized protein [Procambarus clarkii]|uniref:uncharacterized protein n=1 Tax=Procambarus clarkii TaxID=6728 RepID=UPI00374428FA